MGNEQIPRYHADRSLDAKMVVYPFPRWDGSNARVECDVFVRADDDGMGWVDLHFDDHTSHPFRTDSLVLSEEQMKRIEHVGGGLAYRE